MSRHTRPCPFSPPHLQIYSVSIQRNDHNIVDLSLEVDTNGKIQDLTKRCFEQKSVRVYGTIIVDDCTKRFIFKREKENPEIVNDGDNVSLIGLPDRCIDAMSVGVFFDLKDADDDLLLSSGYFFNVVGARSCPSSLFNTRLSAVIPGEHGSATLFYSLFKDAIQARVAANLCIDIENIKTMGLSVHGSIFVRYDGHNYQHEFQKRHYRTVLFDRSAGNGFHIGDNDVVLPLSMVAVPKGTSMIIEADLHVMRSGSEIATICGDTKFTESPELGKPCYDFTTGSDTGFKVQVSWSVTWSDMYARY